MLQGDPENIERFNRACIDVGEEVAESKPQDTTTTTTATESKDTIPTAPVTAKSIVASELGTQESEQGKSSCSSKIGAGFAWLLGLGVVSLVTLEIYHTQNSLEFLGELNKSYLENMSLAGSLSVVYALLFAVAVYAWGKGRNNSDAEKDSSQTSWFSCFSGHG